VGEIFGTWARAKSAPGRPRLRGYLHLIAFVASLPAGYLLIRTAHDTSGRAAATFFSFGLTALYGVSATYHRMTWLPDARRRMRGADHSMIFVLIACSYTAVALTVFTPAIQRVLLALVWAGALTGVTLKIVAPVATRRVTGTMYIVLGWAAIIAAPQLITRAPHDVIAMIAIGGVLYTAGAIIFALRRPNPAPLVFGYHEIWHTMVVAASACHYYAIRHLVMR
jgi:hemolysin III